MLRCILLLLIFPGLLPGKEAAHRLVCLGDSLTAGYGLDEETAWPALLQKKIEADGLDWQVVNAGVSGDTSSGGLARLNWLLNSRPDAMLVCLGANDGLRGIAVDKTAENLETILDTLRAAGVPTALAGMRLPTNYGEAYEKRFAAIFPELAKKFDLPFLPFLLEGVGGVEALNLPDGVHPNEEGQEIVAGHVYEFIKPLLEQWTSQAPFFDCQKKILRTRQDFEKGMP